MAVPPPSPVSFHASTARSYALVGLIFYILAVVFGLLFFFASFFYFFFLLFPVGFLISAGLTAWAAVTYQNIDRGRYAEARTATLVLGILGIFFAFLIGGIFFLLAYGKLGEIFQPHLPYGSAYSPGYPPTYTQTYPPGYPASTPSTYTPSYQQSTAPQTAPTFNPMDHRVCVNCGRPLMAGMKFCPSCGKEIPP